MRSCVVGVGVDLFFQGEVDAFLFLCASGEILQLEIFPRLLPEDDSIGRDFNATDNIICEPVAEIGGVRSGVWGISTGHGGGVGVSKEWWDSNAKIEATEEIPIKRNGNAEGLS